MEYAQSAIEYVAKYPLNDRLVALQFNLCDAAIAVLHVRKTFLCLTQTHRPKLLLAHGFT
jgi:hypothetical protein